MNLSTGFNEENKNFDGRSSFSKEIFQSDNRKILNDTEMMSRTLNRMNRSKSKNSVKSPLRATFSYFNTSQNESRNNLFDANSLTLRKTPKNSQIAFLNEKPIEKTNRKHEFYQIKYSDLLGKKKEDAKQTKNNKYIKLLLNEEEKIPTNSSGGLLKILAYDQIKCNTTKNKFMKELQVFSHSLKVDAESKKVGMNKPAICVKSGIDTKNYFTFSPTNRKSLAHTSSVIKTNPKEKEKYSSLLLSSGNHSSSKPNQSIFSKFSTIM